MKVNLTDEEVKQIKTQFSAYSEIQDEKKALADAEKDCKEKVADIIEGKLGDAGKLLKLMLKGHRWHRVHIPIHGPATMYQGQQVP